MDQVKIGAFLKRLRKEKGLTQEQLGREVKCIRQNGVSMGNRKQYAGYRYAGRDG